MAEGETPVEEESEEAVAENGETEQPSAMSSGEAASEERSLRETLKGDYAAFGAFCVILVAIETLVVPYTKTVLSTVVATLAVFAGAIAVMVGYRLFQKYWSRKVSGSIWQLSAVVLVAVFIGVGVGIGYAIRQPDSSTPTRGAGAASGPTGSASPSSAPTSATSATSAPSSQNASTGFMAEVDWTDDGLPNQQYSTNLETFTGPNTYIHVDTYLLGDHLTVMCQVPNGRAIEVGPDYKGPDAKSTVWYQLDDQTWVPAVYVHVDEAGAVPACT